MKKIGIIGAMEEEVRLLKETMTDLTVHERAGLHFYEGHLEGCSVVVVRSGIGKVNAAMCAQVLIDRFEVSAVINVGVAGAIDDALNIGDIVLSTHLVEHDFDVTGFGYPKGQIPGMDTSVFDGSDHLRALAKKAASLLPVKVMEGKIVSGDIFVNSKQLRDDLAREFDAACAEMEGAAIAHVCYLNSVPVLVIRSMSDKANGEATENFSEFEKMAAMNSKKLILEMLKKGIEG